MAVSTKKTESKAKETTKPEPEARAAVAAGQEAGLETYLTVLQQKSVQELLQIAHEEGMSDTAGLTKQRLIIDIVRSRSTRGHTIHGEGTLEVLADGFGFLRMPEWNYLTSPEDIYVSSTQVRRFGMRTGMVVEGTIRPPLEGQ